MESFMEIDSVIEPMKKTINVDTEWDKVSSPIEPKPWDEEDTLLGVIPVPVISNREAMIRLLEENQDDTRFIMEIIRASTIEFTQTQKNLIQRIEEEYAAWYDTENTRVNLFDEYVIQLRDDFFYEQVRDDDFYEEQVRIYEGIYRAFMRVPFPYSVKQLSLLESFKEEIDWATGDPTRLADISLIEDIQCLLGLFEKREFAEGAKFYVNCTVEYYVQEIIDDLFYFEHQELMRRIPPTVPAGTLVNIATYVREQLKSSFNGCHFDSHVGLYHLGLSEIYSRLMDIFESSELGLTEQQGQMIVSLRKDIENAVREQSTGKYEDLHLGMYGFIDSLRREHPKLEEKEEDGYKKVDENGKIAKIVKSIIKELEELQIAAANHHQSFDDYSSAIPEITKAFLHYFTRIYPLDHMEPITIRQPNGFYRSILLEERSDDDTL